MYLSTLLPPNLSHTLLKHILQGWQKMVARISVKMGRRMKSCGQGWRGE